MTCYVRYFPVEERDDSIKIHVDVFVVDMRERNKTF